MSGPKHTPREKLERHLRERGTCVAPSLLDAVYGPSSGREQTADEKLRDAAPRLADALKEIAEWPNGGNRYGQKNIKEFARTALREAEVE